VPLLALHLPKSHTEAVTCVPEIVTYAIREKKWSTKENKVELWYRTMMKEALELLELVKGTSSDKAILNSEEIKPVAIAIIELRSYACLKVSVRE